MKRLAISLFCLFAFTSSLFAQVKSFLPEKSYSFPDVIGIALSDVRSLPQQYHRQVRYLDLSDVPLSDRLDFYFLLTGQINHLSRGASLIKPAVVPNVDGVLVRLLIDDYGWPRQQWEELAKEDPYYHTKVKIVTSIPFPGGWRGNQYFRAGELPPQTSERLEVSLAPWLGDANYVAELARLTDSQVPVVRATWFVWQTGIQADRGKAGYYDFLGVKNQKDYEKLIGFDAKLLSASRRREMLEVVAESGVAAQPRRVAAFPTLGRLQYWRTFDNKEALDKRNPLRVLDGTFEFDASEEFGPLPNGLWAFGLFDAKGARQDSAPDFIGPDRTSHSNDGRIHAGLSCIRCHYPSGGLRAVDGYFRSLGGGLTLLSPDPAKARELSDLYGQDMGAAIEDDNRRFSRVLKGLVGMEPQQYAKALGGFWARYESPVKLSRAAKEVGIETDLLRTRLEQAAKRGQLDPVLATLLGKRGIPLRQWHEVYPQAQELVYGPWRLRQTQVPVGTSGLKQYSVNYER